LDQTAPVDPDAAAIVAALPNLSAKERRQIRKLIDSMRDE